MLILLTLNGSPGGSFGGIIRAEKGENIKRIGKDVGRMAKAQMLKTGIAQLLEKKPSTATEKDAYIHEL